MDEIPISFEYKGKQYAAVFRPVSGSATNVLFHLIINKFYHGQLILTENYGWKFTSNDGMFEELSDFFGDYITAWYN